MEFPPWGVRMVLGFSSHCQEVDILRRLGDRDPPAEESCDLDMESGICSTSSISEENEKAIK